MILFYVLMFTSPFYHHPFFDRGFGSFTLVKGIGLLCALYAIFYFFSRKTAPRYLGTVHARLFLVLCIWALISYALAGSMRDWAADPAFSYFSFLVLFFITVTVTKKSTKKER